ncbi:hypothetical protein FRC17_000073 [Serendipita sp. 399]|nr:hypothetical protein FRC17_000073 [Serendipita sp. 399]
MNVFPNIARYQGFRLNWQTTIWHVYRMVVQSESHPSDRKSPTGYPRDPPLAGYGEEQAAELAAYFASLPESERPTAVYSSQYYRCLQTAKPTAVTLGIPIFVEPGIQEWYSNVRTGTGLHPRPVSAQDLLPYFDMIDPKWTPTFLVTRRGESVPDLYRRGEEFLRAFIARIDQVGYGGGHERVLLVSHAATVICLAQALLGDEEVGKTLRVGCCTLSTFDRKGSDKDALIGKGMWEARGELARGDFMRNGIERDWGMVDIELKDGVVIDDDGVPGTEQEIDISPGPQDWNQSMARM